jgi:hypothetical protein
MVRYVYLYFMAGKRDSIREALHGTLSTGTRLSWTAMSAVRSPTAVGA